jgi:hypothetical protein
MGMTTHGLDTPKPLPLKGRQPTIHQAYSQPELPQVHLRGVRLSILLIVKCAGMERAQCASPMPRSIAHLMQGV